MGLEATNWRLERSVSNVVWSGPSTGMAPANLTTSCETCTRAPGRARQAVIRRLPHRRVLQPHLVHVG
jgi:hypothetical protein